MGEYTKYWLKAPDEETFRDAIALEGEGDATIAPAYPQLTLRLVGTLYRQTDEVGLDEFGGQYPISIPMPGYHVNAELPAGVPLPECLTRFQIPEPSIKKADWL